MDRYGGVGELEAMSDGPLREYRVDHSARESIAFTPRPLDRASPFYVAGHRGLAGSAVWRALEGQGFTNLIGRTSAELDLVDRAKVFAFFEEVKPRHVVLAAAKVGGILANATHPVDFLSVNLRIQTNVLDAALEHRVERLLFLGSSCIYPKFAPQPIREDSLLTGHLEPTNDAYAIAKIAGIMHVQAVRRQYSLPWISAMPTNLYGPHDNFSPSGAHVVPALIRRYSEAARAGTKLVENWGGGHPRRELLHADDLASACLFLLEHYDGAEHVNVGTGADASIREIADVVAQASGFDGETRWDTSKPDGTPQKLLDVTTLRNLGWTPRIELEEGIRSTVDWYRANRESLAQRG
jgi:GDP-L-fucose synthase